MNKKLLFGIFSVVAAAQLAVPVWMIYQKETVLTTGELFRFRTAPVDPYDAFRGRYVALGFDQNTAPAPPGPIIPGTPLYAHIAVDEGGFAFFTATSLEAPAGTPYLKVKARGETMSRENRRSVRLQLPFDRYYMNEKDAPAAENAYRRSSRGGSRDAYVTVRIKSGHAVLEELYVGGMPIGEFLRREEARAAGEYVAPQ